MMLLGQIYYPGYYFAIMCKGKIVELIPLTTSAKSRHDILEGLKDSDRSMEPLDELTSFLIQAWEKGCELLERARLWRQYHRIESNPDLLLSLYMRDPLVVLAEDWIIRCCVIEGREYE